MSRIIAIANQKGGVGKTTTAINLTACLAAAEKRVLLIDLDPQCNASSGLGVADRFIEPSMADVLLADCPLRDCIRSTMLDYLFLAPGHADLTGAELSLPRGLSGRMRLRELLEPVKDEFDFIFIDCPPSLGILTINGLVAAGSVLVPLQCEYYALEGIATLNQTLQALRERLNSELKYEGILLTMFDSRTNLSRQVAAEARSCFNTLVYRTTIPRNVSLGEAPSFGKPIILYNIKSPGALSYMALAKEVLENGSRAGHAQSTGQGA